MLLASKIGLTIAAMVAAFALLAGLDADLGIIGPTAGSAVGSLAVLGVFFPAALVIWNSDLPTARRVSALLAAHAAAAACFAFTMSVPALLAANPEHEQAIFELGGWVGVAAFFFPSLITWAVLRAFSTPTRKKGAPNLC